MKRIRDDHSGSSAADWPAADPAAAAPPGARRPSSPRPSPVAAAPEELRGLGRAPGLADDAPPGPSGSERRVRLRTGPAELRIVDLPAPALEMVADWMDPKSRAMMTCAHPALRNPLRRVSISDGAVADARAVQELEQFRAVLRNVESLLPGRPALAARPLAVLAWQIEVLEAHADRRAAFDAILATIGQLPAGRHGPRGALRMVLAAQVVHLDPAERAGAFQPLLQAQEPPGSLAGGLRLLAGRLENLPQAARQEASTQVQDWAAGLEFEPARELAGHLGNLPQAAQAPTVSGLLQACSSGAPGQRAERLEDLAYSSGSLSGPVHLQVVQGILAAAGSLALEQRPAVLKPLCEEAYRLPHAEHASTWQAVVRAYLAVPPGQLAAALAQLHDQIRTLRHAGDERQLAVPLMPEVLLQSLGWPQRGEALPPEAYSTALRMGAEELGDLPPAARRPFFQGAMGAVPLLLQEHRGPLLTELAQAIAALPEADRQTEWQATLQMVELLPPPERASPFEPVAAQIGTLPMPVRAAAFESLLQAHRALPAQFHELSVMALGTGCLAQPGAQWLQVLDQVLAETARIPEPDQRALCLRGLAGKFCLADHPAIDLAHPPLLDWHGQDIRVQCFDKIVERMLREPRPPQGFGEYLTALRNDVEPRLRQRMQQQPHEEAVATQVLERLRLLAGLVGRQDALAGTDDKNS